MTYLAWSAVDALLAVTIRALTLLRESLEDTVDPEAHAISSAAGPPGHVSLHLVDLAAEN